MDETKPYVLCGVAFFQKSSVLSKSFLHLAAILIVARCFVALVLNLVSLYMWYRPVTVFYFGLGLMFSICAISMAVIYVIDTDSEKWYRMRWYGKQPSLMLELYEFYTQNANIRLIIWRFTWNVLSLKLAIMIFFLRICSRIVKCWISTLPESEKCQKKQTGNKNFKNPKMKTSA